MNHHPNKLQIEFLKGLSGSGKSTYAKDKIEKDPSWKRVNKDDIRENYPSGVKEKKVLEIEEELIQKYLDKGFNVVLDNTHLNPIHLDRIKKRFWKQADVIINDSFMAVSAAECIERTNSRPAPPKQRDGKSITWKQIIMSQKNQYIIPPKLYTAPDYYHGALPKCVIFDLDGTLSLMNGRGPFDEARCFEDLPNLPVVDIAKMYAAREDVTLICMSGRKEDLARVPTENWLNSQGINYDFLFMRKAGDSRRDSIIKRELFDEHIRGKYLVYLVMDDRAQVCRELWTAEGLPLAQFGNAYHEF